MANESRRVTSKILDWAEQGIVEWENLARNCLTYMSESEVADMVNINGYFELLDEEESTE